MASDRVQIEIVLDDGSVQKGFAKVEKSGKSAGKNIAKSFAKIGAVALAAGAALGAVFTAKAVRLAQEQENAVNKLNTSLKLTGKFSKAASKDLQDFASELQRTTTVGDEATLETAGLIQSLGNLSTEGLKEATAATLDLAAALGVDLNAAALLVGKAAAGEVSSFSRYGLIIKKGATNAETFATALESINSKFGGAAAAKVQTFSGVTDQLGNNFGDVLEKFGDVIIKSPTVITLIKQLSGTFAVLGDKVATFFEGKDIFLPFINGLGAIAAAVNIVLIGPLEVAFRSIFTFIELGFLGVVNSINLTIAAVLENVTALVNKIAPGSDLANTLGALAESTNATFQQSSQQINESLATIGQTPFTDSINEQIGTFLESTADLREELIRAGQDAGTGLTDGLAKGTEGIKKVAAKASFDIKSRLGTGIANTIGSVVGALQKGENAFAAFGKAVLGVFGDLAIQLGTFFIINGLAVEALKALGGAAAIAAGFALVALGTLLKGAAGGGSGVGGGTESTSGAVGAPQDTTGGVAEDEDVERGTAVTVNVEGAVLDPIGTGQSIVEILQETFDTTGSQVVTNVA